MEFIKKVGDKVKIKAEIAKIDIEDEKELVGLIIPGSEDSEIWISRETAIKVGIVKKTVMAKCPNCNGEGTVWYSGHGAVIGALKKRDELDDKTKEVLKTAEGIMDYYKKEGSFSPGQAKAIFNMSKLLN